MDLTKYKNIFHQYAAQIQNHLLISILTLVTEIHVIQIVVSKFGKKS